MKTEVSDAAKYMEMKRQDLKSGKITLDDFASILREVPFSFDDMDYFADKYAIQWKAWREEEKKQNKEAKK